MPKENSYIESQLDLIINNLMPLYEVLMIYPISLEEAMEVLIAVGKLKMLGVSKYGIMKVFRNIGTINNIISSQKLKWKDVINTIQNGEEYEFLDEEDFHIRKILKQDNIFYFWTRDSKGYNILTNPKHQILMESEVVKIT